MGVLYYADGTLMISGMTSKTLSTTMFADDSNLFKSFDMVQNKQSLKTKKVYDVVYLTKDNKFLQNSYFSLKIIENIEVVITLSQLVSIFSITNFDQLSGLFIDENMNKQ